MMIGRSGSVRSGVKMEVPRLPFCLCKFWLKQRKNSYDHNRRLGRRCFSFYSSICVWHAAASMSIRQDTPPHMRAPSFRVFQLTDLHLFRHVDRHRWGVPGSAKDIFRDKSAWKSGGGSIDSVECLERTLSLIRKVLQTACDGLAEAGTKPLVVLSGDIVDSKGVDYACQNKPKIYENYRVMWIPAAHRRRAR